MRLQAVEGTEQAEPVAESDHVLTKADLATRRRAAPRHGAARRAARPERRQPVPARRRRGDGRAAPRQRHLPRRRHRLPPARGVPPHRRAASSSATSGSLNGTYVNRDRIDEVALTDGDEVQIGKYRLVFFAEPGLTADRDRRCRRSGAPHEHRGGARAAARRLPRRHHLQDPVPRGRGAGRAGAHRRRATASSPHDDVERLRYVLRVQRDHYLPLKVISEHLDAIDRGLEPPADRRRCAPTVPTAALDPRRPAEPPSRSRARQRRCGSRARAARGRRHRPRSCSPSSSSYGLVAPDAGTGHYDERRPGRRADRRASWPLRPRAAPPARVQDRRRPRGRPGRAGRRARAAARDAAAPAPRRGGRDRDRRAVGAPARRPGARPACRDRAG